MSRADSTAVRRPLPPHSLHRRPPDAPQASCRFRRGGRPSSTGADARGSFGHNHNYLVHELLSRYYITPLQVEALAAGKPAEDAIEHTIKSVRPRHGPRDIRLASDYRIFYWQAEEGPILAIVAPTAMLLAIAEALKVSSGFEPRRIALRCDDRHSDPTLLALWQPKGGDVVWLQELFAKSDHYGALLDAVPAAAGDSEGGAFGPSRGGHALRAAAQVP